MRIFMISLLSACLCICSCDFLKDSMAINKANVLYNQGNLEEAEQIYEGLLERNPDQSEYLYKLGQIYIGKEQEYRARKIASKLKKLGHEDLAENLRTLMDLPQ